MLCTNSTSSPEAKRNDADSAAGTLSARLTAPTLGITDVAPVIFFVALGVNSVALGNSVVTEADGVTRARGTALESSRAAMTFWFQPKLFFFEPSPWYSPRWDHSVSNIVAIFFLGFLTVSNGLRYSSLQEFQ
jgi:hypothetical protein